MTKNISIIGIGEVGSQLASLLIPIDNIHLNLVDPGNISGRFLDLEHAASVYNKTLSINSLESVKDAGLIFYTAGYCNKPNESRNTVAQKNKDLIKSVFTELNLNENNTVVSVSNPVELTSKWIDEICPAKVVGTGTSLDSFRLSYLLKTQLGKSFNNSLAPVYGEHGKQMVPAWNEISEMLSISDQSEIQSTLLNSAFTIRKTEEATKYGIAHTCVKIMKMFFDEETLPLPLSYKVDEELMKNLDLSKNIYISLPCIIGRNKIILNKEHSLKLSRMEEIRLASKKIESIYEQYIS
ncbi:hypothetical protein N9V83_01090 [Flavobacteriales bacterium]|nr:hypothetical protein [Flavobacteriales bacterium]